MSNEIQQWQAAYLGQVICVWTERGPNHYFTKRFVLLMANTYSNIKYKSFYNKFKALLGGTTRKR